jgi:hypothetical protein
MYNNGMGSKPPNQMHSSKTAGKKTRAKGTMGMGQVKPKARGAMGKHQSTGDGKAF